MIGIVLIHIFYVTKGITVNGVVYGANAPYWLLCICNLFSMVLARIGVPLFFLMSGYLFFQQSLTADVYKSKLKKRARTLLVPYLLWNAIFLLFFAVHSLPLFNGFSHIGEGRWTILRVLGSFCDKRMGVFPSAEDVSEVFAYPQDIPMWYVRDLMIVMLLAPLLYALIKKAGWWVVATLGVVWYFVWGNKQFGYLCQLTDAAFFFAWGAYLAVRGRDFVAAMRRFRPALWLYPVIAIADLLTKGEPCNPYLHNAGIIVGMFAAVQLTAMLLERGKIRVSKFLANASFFLFAAHCLVLNPLLRIVLMVCHIDSPFYILALYFTVPLMAIALCLGTYWLLHRYTPRLCALLTGGR